MSAVLTFAFLISLTPYMNPREILLPPFLFVFQNENSEKMQLDENDVLGGREVWT